MESLGRIFRARQQDGRVVGELALGGLAVDIEQEVLTVLFFDWPEYQSFCRRELARSAWAPEEVQSVASQLESLGAQIPDLTLATQAWTEMKNADLQVEEIAGVWFSIRRFFVESAQRHLVVESQYEPVADGVELRWASADQ